MRVILDHISFPKITIFSKFMMLLYKYLFKVKNKIFSEANLFKIGLTCYWLSLKYSEDKKYLNSLIRIFQSQFSNIPIYKSEFYQMEQMIIKELEFKITFRSDYDKILCFIHVMFSLDIDYVEKVEQNSETDPNIQFKKHKCKKGFLTLDSKKLNINSEKDILSVSHTSLFNPNENLIEYEELVNLNNKLNKIKHLKSLLLRLTNFFLILAYSNPEIVLQKSDMLPLACISCGLRVLETRNKKRKRCLRKNTLLMKRRYMDCNNTDQYDLNDSMGNHSNPFEVQFIRERFDLILTKLKKIKLKFKDLELLIEELRRFQKDVFKNKEMKSFLLKYYPKD